MVVAGRRRSIAFFIALGAGLISVILLLYIGWVLLNWRTGILLFLGVLLLALIITGVLLNTLFLVREIRRKSNELIRKQKADGIVTEDVMKKEEKGIQEHTDKFCKEIDDLFAAKEKEVMTV